MATLAVRQLSLRDLPALQRVRRRVADVAPAEALPIRGNAFDRLMSSILPDEHGRVKVYVASVDDELCAWAALARRPERFAWYVVQLAAGSPNLDGHDSEVVELWQSLLEFAIVRAGESGAKRLFADVDEGTVAHASLSLAGFEGYTTRTILEGRLNEGQPSVDGHVRSAELSDVWSIHHLYHRLTPRPVQFAEAHASSVWEPTKGPRRLRLPATGPRAASFVFETTSGIEAYCRVSPLSDGAWFDLLVDPDSDVNVGGFVRLSATGSGVDAGQRLRTAIPGYAIQLASVLEADGFARDGERVAMVRHTTVPAVVHARPSPLPMPDGAERVARGIPTVTSSLHSGVPAGCLTTVGGYSGRMRRPANLSQHRVYQECRSEQSAF